MTRIEQRTNKQDAIKLFLQQTQNVNLNVLARNNEYYTKLCIIESYGQLLTWLTSLRNDLEISFMFFSECDKEIKRMVEEIKEYKGREENV